MMAYIAVLANRSIASLSQEDACHCVIETGWLLTHSPSLRARRAIRPHPWMADFPMQALRVSLTGVWLRKHLQAPIDKSSNCYHAADATTYLQLDLPCERSDHRLDNSGIVQDLLKRVLHRCHLFKSNSPGGSSRPQLLHSGPRGTADLGAVFPGVELTSLKRSALTLRSPAIGSMRAPSGITTPGTHHAHVTWAHTPFTVLGFRAPPAAHSSSRASQDSAGVKDCWIVSTPLLEQTAHRSDVHVSSKGSNPTASRRVHPDAAAVTCHLPNYVRRSTASTCRAVAATALRAKSPLADKLSRDGRGSSWWQGCRLIAGALASILQQRLLHSQPVVAWSLLAHQRLALEAAIASKHTHQPHANQRLHTAARHNKQATVTG
eukprot:SM000128S26214  [mRNA]  locus=s128:85627:91022:+ [translate_table: standard]